MKRTEQGPAHYEVELRQADRQDERAGAAWRPIRRVQPDGTMQPLKFGGLSAAQAYTRRLDRQGTRVVAVEAGGGGRGGGGAESGTGEGGRGAGGGVGPAARDRA